MSVGEVAARGHVNGGVGVNRPADHHVKEMAGKEPCNDKDTKGDIAGSGVAHVLEQFGSLFLVSVLGVSRRNDSIVPAR